MGDGEVGNEFDIIFPHYRHGGADADEHDASPNPTQALMMSCLTADTNALAERCQRDTGKKKKGVLFINRACEATNEAWNEYLAHNTDIPDTVWRGHGGKEG